MQAWPLVRRRRWCGKRSLQSSGGTGGSKRVCAKGERFQDRRCKTASRGIRTPGAHLRIASLNAKTPVFQGISARRAIASNMAINAHHAVSAIALTRKGENFRDPESVHADRRANHRASCATEWTAEADRYITDITDRLTVVHPHTGSQQREAVHHDERWFAKARHSGQDARQARHDAGRFRASRRRTFSRG
ncbi:protein of unknown function [Paraburkholderia kururiensis]